MSLELVAVLPVLLVVLAGSVEFALLLSARGAVTDASRTAARLAVLGVADEEQLEAATRRALGPRLGSTAEVVTSIDEATETLAVSVSVPMRSAAPNLLWVIGFDLSGRTLTATTCMAAEAD